jgi:hypothetical protein
MLSSAGAHVRFTAANMGFKIAAVQTSVKKQCWLEAVIE